MKNLLKTTVLMSTLTLVAFGAFAQGQFDAIKKLGEGDYRYYDVSGKSGKYEYMFDPKASSSSFMRVSFIEPTDARRFSVQVHWGSSKKKYSLDEVGYGVTLSAGSVKHPKLKYLRRIDGTEKERLVVMDDMIFYLTDYKSPTDFRIFKVMKKGKLSKLKAMKEYVKVLKMNSMNLEEKLKAQLKKEFAAQAAALPKWKAANADYYTYLEKDKMTWKVLMKDSDKQFAKMMSKYVIVKNKSSSTIWFTTGYGSPTKIIPGSYKKVDCELAPMYKSNFQGEKRALLFKPSQYCGKTFTVTTW